MSSPDSLHRTQDIHDQLVAYLDGELDAETSRRVDDLLSTDPVVRREVADLDATWNLLERMPRTEVGEDFTRTTLELVAQRAEQDLKQQQSAQPSRNLLLVGALCIGMFAAGFFGVYAADLISPSENEVLLENLPVIQQLDQLEQVGKFEFLQELHEQQIFADATVAEALEEQPANQADEQNSVDKDNAGQGAADQANDGAADAGNNQG